MPFDRLQPYNELPLLPPPVELETRAVLKQAINTNRVLANLRGLAAQILVREGGGFRERLTPVLAAMLG